jgi:hypothetical protein
MAMTFSLRVRYALNTGGGGLRPRCAILLRFSVGL